VTETNWGGNVTFSAQEVVRPESRTQAQELITAADNVRVVGTRHSFNRIADGVVMLDSSSLPEFLEISADRTSVRVNGSMTYGRLAELLGPLRLTVANFASLPHISIAGAIATGTHGSGHRNPNLGAVVRAVQLISGGGDLVELAAGDDGYEAAVVSLGALGLVTTVELDVVPTFEVAQTVYDGISIADVATHANELLCAAYSVSVFTTWSDEPNQVWVKRRVGDEPTAGEPLLAGLPKADTARHPIQGLDAPACTTQLGEPGAPVDRLPHFKLDFTPSVGDEIQSEFFVGFDDASSAIRAVAATGANIADALLVGEIRTVAADSQWMSPCCGRDSVAFHFTWRPDQAHAEGAARRVADALAPFGVRPHWGKVFDHSQFDIASIRHRHDFLAVVGQLDPTGTFSNEWFETVVRNT